MPLRGLISSDLKRGPVLAPSSRSLHGWQTYPAARGDDGTTVFLRIKLQDASARGAVMVRLCNADADTSTATQSCAWPCGSGRCHQPNSHCSPAGPVALVRFGLGHPLLRVARGSVTGGSDGMKRSAISTHFPRSAPALNTGSIISLRRCAPGCCYWRSP